mgnify:CR=1 FL=1
MFKANDLYKQNYLSKTKVTVNQGGTSSGKTYAIIQVLFTLAIKWPNSIITVVGQDIPNLKKGALRDGKVIYSASKFLEKNIKNYNKTDRIFEFKNGSIIEFASFDDEQDAKSGKRDYLFINEANGITYNIYWQLAIRTRKRIFIDYNPTAAFWVHEKLIGQNDVGVLLSDHRNNTFLSEEQHAEIENIPDKELWKVYARGLTGRVHGLIYPKYGLCDEIPEFVKTCYGLDFGYNHKTALIEVGCWENRLYWHELIYESELTIADLIQQMKQLGIDKKIIYADSARPDAIEDLRRARFNVKQADKDVKNGIDFVKRNQLYITKSSSDIIKEIQHYKWKEKDGGFLDEPVKFRDDAMDAARYGSYSHRQNNHIIIANTSRYSNILDRL